LKIIIFKDIKKYMIEYEDRLEKIKTKILKLVKRNELIKHGIKNDCNGYLYCISNSIYDIYSKKTYKLGNTINIKDRMNCYNGKYFEKIKLHISIEVPYKFMFETLLFMKLDNQRIKKTKEFFTNYNLIKGEFENIKKIIEKNNSLDSLEEYYKEVLNKDMKQIKYKIKELNTVKKIKYEIKTINYEDKFRKKIRDHEPNDSNNGSLLKIDIKEIKHSFEDKIQVIVIVSRHYYNMTEFIDLEIKERTIVYDIKFAKYMLHDMLNNTHIKNNYFLCSNDKMNETINKIRYYYDNYSCVDKIKKAYLYDIYKEGEKIEHDKLPSEHFKVFKEWMEDIKKTYPNFIERAKNNTEEILQCKISAKKNNSDVIIEGTEKMKEKKKDELIELVIKYKKNKYPNYIEEILQCKKNDDDINIEVKEKTKDEIIDLIIKDRKKNYIKQKYVYKKEIINEVQLKKENKYTLEDFKYKKREIKLKEILDEK
jgi:hypothetical protein